jgi:hypothetical protein
MNLPQDYTILDLISELERVYEITGNAPVHICFNGKEVDEFIVKAGDIGCDEYGNPIWAAEIIV